MIKKPLYEYLDKIASSNGSDLKLYGGLYKYELIKIDKEPDFSDRFVVLFQLFYKIISNEQISE